MKCIIWLVDRAVFSLLLMELWYDMIYVMRLFMICISRHPACILMVGMFGQLSVIAFIIGVLLIVVFHLCTVCRLISLLQVFILGLITAFG